MIQGGSYLADGRSLTLATCAAGVAGMVAGASLLIGFLTPVVGGLVGLGAIGIALSWVPSPALNLFDTPLPTVLVAIVAAAVVFLGPGALSLDARLFGRREIIIPSTSRSYRP